MKKLFQALALLAAFVLLIALPQAAADGVRSALTLCGRVILPSLFPFFVCSNLFLLLGYSARLSARFGGAAAKLLRLPPAAGSAFLLGLLGGYPAGAQAAGTLYAQGELSGANAERALAVCNQAGPSFIFGALGGAVFKSAAAGAFLYAVQIVSAVLVCRLTAKKQYAPAKAVAKLPQPESFAAAFSESVRRAGMSAIQICMFITVFSVLSCYFLLAAGRFLPPEALPLVLGSLELSAGCAALADCALALQWKLCIASALLSFGGVSVLAQSRAAVQEHGLTGRLLLPCKALQAVLSCTLTLIAAPLLHAESWPAAAFSESVRRAGMSAIQICMFITVFSVLSCYFLLAAGRFLPPEALPLVLGSLELSAGCAALADCALALQWKLCIASALLSFGGVSVLAQSRAAVQEHGLTGRLLLPCKALQAVLSCTLTLIAAPLLHAESWPAAAFSGTQGPETAGAASLLLCSVSLLLFRKKYHSNLHGKRV